MNGGIDPDFVRRLGLRPVVLPGVGKAFVVDVVIPDDAPEAVREGLARRAVVDSGGVCPCGASVRQPSRQARRRARRGDEVLRLTAEHELDCPAITGVLAARIIAWRGGLNG